MSETSETNEVIQTPFPFHPDFDKKQWFAHLHSVMENPDNLQHVPEKYRTKYLVKTALHLKSETIKFLSPAQQIPEFCIPAIEKNLSNYVFIHSQARTEKFYKLVLEQLPSAFQTFSDREKTVRHCKLAVKYSAKNLKLVPPEIKTFSFLVWAIRKNVQAIEFIEKDHPAFDEFRLIDFNKKILISYKSFWSRSWRIISFSLDVENLLTKTFDSSINLQTKTKIITQNYNFRHFFKPNFFNKELHQNILLVNSSEIRFIPSNQISSSTIF